MKTLVRIRSKNYPFDGSQNWYWSDWSDVALTDEQLADYGADVADGSVEIESAIAN